MNRKLDCFEIIRKAFQKFLQYAKINLQEVLTRLLKYIILYLALRYAPLAQLVRATGS